MNHREKFFLKNAPTLSWIKFDSLENASTPIPPLPKKISPPEKPQILPTSFGKISVPPEKNLKPPRNNLNLKYRIRFRVGPSRVESITCQCCPLLLINSNQNMPNKECLITLKRRTRALK